MKPGVYYNGEKFLKQKFSSEEEFEREIERNSKKLFGSKTIYLNIKRKIEAVSLGGSIPDGILFDLTDSDDIKFYLVEVELASHDFYRHIFPQITKFFAFYKNPISQNNLVDKIYAYITSEAEVKKKFEGLIPVGQELYKSIKDAIENDPKILLIIDDEKPEIEELQGVYTDTWDKLVVQEILVKYKKNEEEIFLLDPDFLEKDFVIAQEEEKKEPEKKIIYSEYYHFEGVDPSIHYLYEEIKKYALELNVQMFVNPRKYYIVFKNKKNFIYLYVRKKKIIIVPMVSLETGRKIIRNHRMKEYSQGIQGWYNGPCFEMRVENNEHLEEVLELVRLAYEGQR